METDAPTRFFQGIPVGAYIGTIEPGGGTTTVAANPHLAPLLGFPSGAPEAAISPFNPERFVDPEARRVLVERLEQDGGVSDHLVRMRRADDTLVWIEITATAEGMPDDGGTSSDGTSSGGTSSGGTSSDGTSSGGTRSGGTSSGGTLVPPERQSVPPERQSVPPERQSVPPALSERQRVEGPARTLHVSALLRDVSDRQHRDDQSRDLYHQLLQSEKMAALGQTISGVAHELNNPLATILAWAERLNESAIDEKTKRGLNVILAESERAARIVRNLLTFARKRQSTRMMVDVNDVLRETLALRAYEQRVSNIAVTQTLAAGMPQVFADGYQIKQVILNLLINAEQAMVSARGRGVLAVRTSHDPDRESIVLEVSDNGPGIPVELQGKVFDPFYTTKDVGQGTGLGLSVAYAIVHEHGGRIWLASSPDEGTTFFVELPVAGQGLRAPKPAAEPISLDAFKGSRVLVVEDEPALGTAVAEALIDAGFVVDRAGDGEEGLTCLSQRPYDLIVCDLKMPRIDGMQFYRAMATATPSLARRVIFVTGAVAGAEAERFLEETGCRWLAKPFRLGDLLRAARDALLA